MLSVIKFSPNASVTRSLVACYGTVLVLRILPIDRRYAALQVNRVEGFRFAHAQLIER
jgi:hypothetical protein